jgi:regulator of protease activity HflC (stomatin/prohibitin superfamily)
METLIFAAIVVVFLVVLIVAAVRIVRDYERLVVFRLGRSIGEKGPGFVILIPLVDQPVKVDLRESYLQIPHQTCITKDNAPIAIDFLIYWKVVNPTLSVLQVRDFAGASAGIATTTLRAVIGDILLDDVLARREEINHILRVKLDEVTERWGVKVTTVEIREIEPPREVQTAMNRQMAAERNRRATVMEADGQREAAIMIATGKKQATILEAEGSREATILNAEGTKRGAVLDAEGFALALEKIFEVAKDIDSKTLTLQYLEALKNLGEGASTKFIIPTELLNLAKPLSEFAKGAHQE